MAAWMRSATGWSPIRPSAGFEGKPGGEQAVHHDLVECLADPEMILRLVMITGAGCWTVRAGGRVLGQHAGLILLRCRHAEGRCCVHR